MKGNNFNSSTEIALHLCGGFFQAMQSGSDYYSIQNQLNVSVEDGTLESGL